MRARGPFDTLRLALAMVLFLASVAGARLQGEQSGPLAQGIAALCLTSGVPADWDHAPGPNLHDHCVLCTGVATGTQYPPVIALREAMPAAVATPGREAAVRGARPARRDARGPPLWV